MTAKRFCAWLCSCPASVAVVLRTEFDIISVAASLRLPPTLRRRELYAMTRAGYSRTHTCATWIGRPRWRDPYTEVWLDVRSSDLTPAECALQALAGLRGECVAVA